MLPQSKGKMFLADERGLNQLDWYRSYNTFNFGSYQHAHKSPFSNLYVLNDDTLAAGKSITLNIEEATDVILIPIVGSFTYTHSLDDNGIVNPGQVHVLSMAEGTSIKLTNPYNDELINFLYLFIRKPFPGTSLPVQQFSVNLNGNKNKMLPLLTTADATLHIGQFDARHEIAYQLTKPGNALFAFVIDGEFELQYRLLHPRDGLVLWDVNQLELEALCAHAIMLFVDIPV